jgi:serine/threonine protein kinase
MPFCDGENLAQWLASQTGPVDQREAADIVRQVSEAIHAGHSKGIVHRDLKPANIMLTPQDSHTSAPLCRFQPQILDFGLSRSLESELQDTRSSMIIGTPLYMSPEQARQLSEEVGHASDVFALGAILYELLTGTPPFSAESFPGVIERLKECKPTPPSRVRRNVDSRLETICLKCLRLYPSDRYASARDLADDLERFLEGAPIRAHRATVVDHMRWWARKPQRAGDAGTVLIFMNVAVPLSMFASSLLPIFDPNSPIAVMSVADLLRSNAPTAIGGLGIAWLGLMVLKGSHWALALATLAGAAQWTYCIAILFFGAPALAEYEDNPLAKLLAHLLLLFMYGLQLALCLAAVYGQRKRNRSTLPG